jgi:ABC-type bacteriocin/lantibiotic exporter with double-glycine peptidase domain
MSPTPFLLPVAPFQETLHASMCGPAVLHMVLSYYGVHKTEQELAVLCGTSLDMGTSAEQIKSAGEELGLMVDIHDNCSFADIEGWLDEKKPVIVDWFTRGRRDYTDAAVPDGHYSVVTGISDTHIYLQDPEIGGLRTLSLDDFYKVWFDFRGTYISAWEDMLLRQCIVVSKK